jgi:hypothetical protein
MSLFIILLLATLAGLQTTDAVSAGFLLKNADQEAPRVISCPAPDIVIGPYINHTDCDERSDGCNSTTQQCILAQILGYSFGNFMTFTPYTWASTMPGANDGKVRITISYTNVSIFPIKGLMQIWRYVQTQNLIDIYEFAGRQDFYTSSGIGSRSSLFHDLDGGIYKAVFWDWGGTRYGNGYPETSDAFTIYSVFPTRVSLSLQFIPESDNVAIGDYYLPDTSITVSHKLFMSYQLIGNGNYADTENIGNFSDVGDPLALYILNAANPPYNRPWNKVWRTDLGNIITVQTELANICSDAWEPTLHWTSGSHCTMEANNGAYQCTPDDVAKIKIFPMNNGGRGTITSPSELPEFTWTRIGRVSVLEYRLTYTGLPNSVQGDYWNNRQVYGYTTVIASKILDQVAIPAGSFDAIGNHRNIFAYNQLVPSARIPGADLLITLFNDYLVHNPGFGDGPYTGELQGSRDFFHRLDTSSDGVHFNCERDITSSGPCETLGISGPHVNIYYADHDNTETDGDYSCHPLGTQWARDTATRGKCASCSDTYTMADIVYDFTDGFNYNWYCSDDYSAYSGDFAAQCGNYKSYLPNTLALDVMNAV